MTSIDAKAFSKFSSAYAASREDCPDLSNLFVGEPSAPMRFALRSAFIGCVHAVLLHCPKPKVVGINTRPIVYAGAVVKYFHTVWNRAVMNNPTCLMSPYDIARLIFTFPKKSIAVFINGSGPQPATFGFVDLRPKPLFECFGKTFRKVWVLAAPVLLIYDFIVEHLCSLIHCHRSGWHLATLKTKMNWVDTKGISASVTYPETVVQCPVVDYPGKPSNPYVSALESSTANNASMIVTTSNPKPTISSFVHLLPKSLADSCRKVFGLQDWIRMEDNTGNRAVDFSVNDITFVLHSKFLLLCHALGCFIQREGTRNYVAYS
jgi:hypothetical protein